MRKTVCLGLPVVCLLLIGCTGPYTVTRNLRGSAAPQAVYYVYPPGSSPQKRVRVVEPVTREQSTRCASTVAANGSFALRFRNVAYRAPAVVVEDVGALPKSRQDFESEIAVLVSQAGACLEPGQRAAIAEALWERVPKTFVDDLFFHYRYDTANRAVDLQPGMRLRFEWQAYNEPDPMTSRLSSYVAAGTSYLTVARRPHGVDAGVTTDPDLLTFEPFLGWISMKVNRESPARVAGAVDLEGRTFQRKYFRLVMPDEFQSRAVASNDTNTHFAIIGADTLEAVDAARANLKSCITQVSISPGAAVCAVIAGRTVVIPEVAVELDGDDVFLPVGTTLRQIIDRGGKPWSPRTFLPLRRYWRGRRVAVVFESPDEDALHLPLVKGDRFRW